MSLVETDWLENNIDNLKIIDCSWHMPQTKRIGFEEYKREKFMPSDQNQISMSIIWLNRDCNKI